MDENLKNELLDLIKQAIADNMPKNTDSNNKNQEGKPAENQGTNSGPNNQQNQQSQPNSEEILKSEYQKTMELNRMLVTSIANQAKEPELSPDELMNEMFKGMR